MRIKTLIFSVYLLVLACYPCTDGETCSDEKRSGVEVINIAGHNHSATEVDHCTPFCICSCCAASVQLTVYTVAVPAVFTHNTSCSIPYRERSLLQNAHTIWQPPKIA